MAKKDQKTVETNKEDQKKEEKVIKINGKKYNKEAFLIEEYHPAIGRILIIEDMKFKILDDEVKGPHRTGTFISKLTEKDEESMEEYDEALEELSSKLADRVDIKRLIKENIKERPLQDIKTGLFILRAKEDGAEVEEEHHKGCYNYKIHYKNQTFNLVTGMDVLNNTQI